MKLSGPVEIIKKSVYIFFKRDNLLYFFKIYALLVPFAIFFLIQDNFVKINTNNLSVASAAQIFSQFGWFIWLSIPVGLAYLIVSFWISATGIKAVANVASGGSLDVKNTMGFAWKKLWLFSLLSIVTGLLIGLGFIVLVIPGIILLVWYRFSSFEFMTKNAGIGSAMSGSKKLVSGKFFAILGRLIIFGLFGLLLEIVFGIIPLGLGSVIQPLFGGLFILPYFLLYQELSG